MSNVIEFQRHRGKGRGEMKKMDSLLNEFSGVDNQNYSSAEIEAAAYRVLAESGYYFERSAIPIVKIADSFGIKVYADKLNDDFPGDIRVNGSTYEEYGHDKVILVSEKEDLFLQRFLAAHEFAHYLFEYPKDPSYRNSALLFSDKYHRDHHETIEEKRANRFAAAILMPKELFGKQYNIAKNAYPNRTFIMLYLSRFFEVPIEAVEKRIAEVFS